ncbi:hypothetical protein [Bacillus wiedmannii]|uniref:hypothetical protein n=1 Tax=Bacillus wiedmannii TaxID=1890302 RepID=UPI000BF9950E|nr:hypothetical protein [Bacillus wiedmannii]PGA35151.1 hypothetical protein COL74_06905 [Bacillus wiedmannii]PHB96727.1 hypothetical protein COE96_15140 [Bacillus wiedmannii]
MVTIKLIDLASYLKINGLKDIYIGREDYFFQPVFQCCSYEEAMKIFGDVRGSNFYKKKGIYIPNVEIDVLFKDGEEIGQTEYVAELLKEQGVEMFNKVVYASFCLYHEEGHSADFEESGLSVEEFIQRDIEDTDKINLQMNYIRTLPNSRRSENIYLFYLMYNEMKAEKIANTYAAKKVAENLERILSFKVK